MSGSRHSLLRTRGIPALVAAAFMNAFVDLGHKIVIQNTVFEVFDGSTQIALTGIVNALILLPFVLLMTPAGFISDRFAKARVMRLAAAVAIGITLLITLCYHQGWFWSAFALTLLLAIQAAIYGPAKLGYLKELAGVEDLAAANGLMQAASTAAILLGMAAFSLGFEHLYRHAPSDDPATILPTIANLGWYLVAAAVLEFLLLCRLPATRPADESLRFDTSRYLAGGYLRETMGDLWQRPVLRLSMIGLAVFWSIAQMLVAVYPAYAEHVLEVHNVALIQAIIGASAIGTVCGSLIAARFSRAHIETGFVAVGAAGIAGCLVLLLGWDALTLQALLFFSLGLFGALFTVPLNALIQYNAGDDELGRVLAASNFIGNAAMISFLGVTVAAAFAGGSDVALMVLLAIVAFVGALYTVYTLPQSLVRFVIARVFSVRYRLHVTGMENIPRAGAVLLLGNHVSWIDWAIVAMASPRPIRFVMARDIYKRWYLRRFLDFVGVIPIAPGQAHDSLEQIAECLRAGEVVCLFPEGTLSRHGQLNEFKRGFERAATMAADTDAIIVPFYLRGLWGSQFSHSSDLLKARPARGARRTIGVAFGSPMPLAATAPAVKQAVAELSVTAWQDYVASLGTVPAAWLEASRSAAGPAIIESSGRMLSQDEFAAAVLAFAAVMRKDSEQRVAILLPPGAGGAIANMAALLTGHTVINLNYTASLEAVRASIERAGVRTVYTSSQFRHKLTQRGIDIEPALVGCTVREMETLREGFSRARLAFCMVAWRVLPARVLLRWFGAASDANTEAAILFSSGSEGMPKGVVLTHRNLHANIEQITDMMNPEEDDVMIGCLPLFHAFGLTVTTLLPLLQALPLLTHPDPTDVVAMSRAIYRYRGTILCATSTFLRFYVRHARVLPIMLESLRLVVSGAERLDPAVREGFAQKFHKTIYEGYGATETTPVASVNVPDYLDADTWKEHLGSKQGTVGLPLPGSCFRVVDPDTLATLPPDTDGLILIGGVQVMQGYLDDPERTHAAIAVMDGRRWYRTGDKGHLDTDGFLTIVDRYSRFAKLGGEMVSLGAVEQHIAAAVDEDDFEVVVVALADPRKGERLIALTRRIEGQARDFTALAARLRERGVPALMQPERWCEVDTMPKLGSGKTDFSAAKQLALAASADAA